MKAIKFLSFFVLFLFLNNSFELFGFGKGPYTHGVITTEAIHRFQRRHNVEFGFQCIELLVYYSVINDVKFAHDWTYHCDNNDLFGCSWRLKQVFDKANHNISMIHSFDYMGQALHIVQDFYAHSNWVEVFQFSMLLPEVDLFNKYPPPDYIQSGLYPDIFLENLQAQSDCYFEKEENFKNFIYGATHDCINKDSNKTKRGSRYVPNTTITYHQLAGEYAVEHSVKLLEHFRKHNVFIRTCLRPKIFKHGCNLPIAKKLNNI